MVLLLSTYDLGRQPFGLASPAAWLRRAGVEVVPLDLSRQRLDRDVVARARLVAVYLPMHTATRLALPVLDRIRAWNPGARLVAYGLYAPLNAELLRARGVTEVLGPEFEADLATLAGGGEVPASAPALPRLAFVTPDRRDLPAAATYASVEMPDGTRRIAGATEATRGCKHRCRHCPIVPVYDGQFRVVPIDVVLADIRAQVQNGVEHVTFGDPDFFNGPTHARRLVERLHAEWPSLTYDVTIKVEHLLASRELLPVLAATGCLFVTSAVESVDDAVLVRLEKGHTRADFIEAASLCHHAGLTLSPTFVSFTPWTTLDGFRDQLELVEELGLTGHVAPVQWGIRLLVTWQSRLLELPEIRSVIGPFDARTLTYPWQHADPRVDRLQADVMNLAGTTAAQPRIEVAEAIRALLHEHLPSTRPFPPPEDMAAPRATIPYLNEPWYC